ncbi:glucose-6-phosphate dehydrogenase [Pontibacter sp. G13]|uniref:glucose-6-phosphate dehydrogenase n=1 Tax=Pontibacter sp. G13 TaxID=3074898 RepID=UPI00288B0050|nr:glucose-6-phosphate dehydrogenase [Pontibacter sp. G13]WNJ18235.1 glucose-6-phosphate dehydrogenase [Pontibacter sp. G13]
MKAQDNLILTIFGASGDLTRRKLIPAIYDLYQQGLMPERFAIVGTSRTAYSDDDFRDRVLEGVKEFSLRDTSDSKLLKQFREQLYYQPLDTKSPQAYANLQQRLTQIDEDQQIGGNGIFYLSTPPSLYETIARGLSMQDLHQSEVGWRRLIVEKPFGYDLDSAKDLNAKLLQFFSEDQIYRIDHYLGKETVQNLLVTRFSNGIFEPLWNRNYIHHVEVTAAESIGIGDRGGYYDTSGALRDMVQNHLLQVLAMTAMEPPIEIKAEAIRNETFKVFQALRPMTQEAINHDVIRGQYIESTVRGQQMDGYRQAKGVAEDSRTETFVALKCFIDNWRWGGVPFYIRTGKRLPTRVTEVVIHFKETPLRLFSSKLAPSQQNNQLVIRIQPNEGLLLKFGMKVPGMGFQVETVNMDFHYSELSDAYLPSAYERLLLDAIKGDATLFARGDVVEAGWAFVDPILKAWKNDPEIPLYGYPAGTWGPEESDGLIEGEDLTWRYPCRNLSDDGSYCEL